MPSDVLMNRHMAKLGMAAQPVSWSDGSLTIHEVAQFFSVPIAEAAQKLSVCGSVLQRICKENGIARWPYRKVTAGKSIEEIIEEGLKELATNPGAYKIAEKQPEKTSGSPTASIPISGPPNGPDALGQPSPKRLARQQEARTFPPSQAQKSTQRTVSAAQTRTPNNTPPQRLNQQAHVNNNNNNNNNSPAAAPTPLKQKPASTIDDFKIGFPSKGLRRASTRWWGKEPTTTSSTATATSTSTAATTAATTSTSTSTATATAAAERDTELVCPESSVEGLDCASEEVGLTTASSLLVRTRKKASVRGRGSTAHAVTRGYGLHKLGAKDAATLRFVFGDYLPKHWISAFPPLP